MSGGAGREDLVSQIIQAYLQLTRVHRRFGNFAQNRLGIGGRQLVALQFLAKQSPVSVGDLSRYLFVSHATTSNLLDRLEDAGFVTRTRSQVDNRMVLIAPTPSGLDMAEKAPMGVRAVLQERLPELSVEELESIDGALSILSSMLGEVYRD